MRKIAVLTGGGDCPGLNAVIRSVVKSAHNYGIKVLGIKDGYHGAVEGDFMPLALKDVSGILPRGGTILGTTNRDNPFAYETEVNGKVQILDRSGDVIQNLKERDVDTLIAIGGDGSLNIALKLENLGLNVIGIPKTIDNDLRATDQTFGFQTAVETATEALDRLHTTGESHHRVMILEVMGRYAGWIALYAGVAGGADVILIPEIPYKLDRVVQATQHRAKVGKIFSIIVVAEGAKPLGGDIVIERLVSGRFDPIKLGGIGAKIGNELEEQFGMETRVTVLGHLQRGGSPNSYDRVLSSLYGVAAVNAVIEEEFGIMVALRGRNIVRVPLYEAVDKLKLVPLTDPLLIAARNLGIEMGN
ncbi:6-phosphofructokinase [Desulfosporosinus sp. Tol-M]|jgi:phosphofructokinase|nr:6-phosphofructokinase [Desulfosporosinus sp. Tol-M]